MNKQISIIGFKHFLFAFILITCQSIPSFGQLKLLETINLASAGNSDYIWGDDDCNLSTGTQVLNHTLSIDPDCYSSLTVEVYLGSDGNLDSGSGGGSHDYIDISTAIDGGAYTQIPNQNPNLCNSGSNNFDSSRTLSGETGCNCDWGQLSLHCSGTWSTCPGGDQPGAQIVKAENLNSGTDLSIQFNYRVTNSGTGSCENGCEEVIQAMYVMVYGVEQGCASLPVELISFDVKENNGKALLQWEAVEIDFDKYLIEHSTDGRSWEIVKTIHGKNENQINSYSTTEYISRLGTSFFRLKMIDEDGTFQYSQVRSIKASSELSNLSINPNPFSDFLRFNYENIDTDYSIQILNMKGMVILEESVNSESHLIDVSHLKQGMYLIVATDRAGNRTVEKVIK